MLEIFEIIITCTWEWKRLQLAIMHTLTLGTGLIRKCRCNKRCAMFNIIVACKALSHTHSTVSYHQGEQEYSWSDLSGNDSREKNGDNLYQKVNQGYVLSLNWFIRFVEI